MRVLAVLFAGMISFFSQNPVWAQALSGYEGATGNTNSTLSTSAGENQVLLTISNPCATFEEDPGVPGVKAEPDPARKGVSVWNVCYKQAPQEFFSRATLHVFRLGEHWRSGGKRLSDIDFSQSDGKAAVASMLTVSFPIEPGRDKEYCTAINFVLEMPQGRAWGSHPDYPNGPTIVFNKNNSPATMVCVDPVAKTTMPPTEEARAAFRNVE